MKKIRIATVFSGIGAPEQALKRMNISHEIVFACDNGERVVNINTEKEFLKVKKLGSVKEKEKYIFELYNEKTKKRNYVKESYQANYNAKYFFEDIKLLDGTDFKNKIDILVGGSPCQSFSIAGQRAGFDDVRGTLFYDFCRIVKETKPKVFIYENVYGVLNHNKGNTWKIMQEVFEDLGYSFKWSLLNAKDYGIPQSRRRLFVVGFLEKESYDKFKFPEPISLKLSVQDLLETSVKDGGIVSINGSLTKISDESGTIDEKAFLSEKVKKYVLSPGTKNFYHTNIVLNPPIAKALLSTMNNCHRASVDNYYETNGRIRKLTVREAHRLMGFPDDYKFAVTNAQLYKQAGNSIVVDVLINIFNCIFKAAF